MSPALPKENNLNNTRKSGVRILVITGASGGHIFPALSFLDTLRGKYKNADTLLVLPQRSIENQIGDIYYKVKHISISPIKLSFELKNLFVILNFLKGSWESIFILFTFRPDIVVGFGSIISIPMLFFAWIFRIKTLIHEQNVIPGRATRFLAFFVDRVAISFEETKNYFQNLKRKIVLTGNPIRKGLIRYEKNTALDFFGFKSDKFTILVMGGSQGSQRINLGFVKAISTISDKSTLQVIHLCGLKDHDLLKEKYKYLNIDIKLISFLSDMQYAYSACDLAVSRAGATTLAEIIFFNLPAVIIPYPFAYRHQVANAKVLEKQGCAIIINDSELDNDILGQTINYLIKDSNRIRAMRSSYTSISYPNASDLIVEEALSSN
jgi:UDP-N-acetylglucosamine--N-acetylmuramyl-(pentapeptide) pyrophosphoryl-undecaprenol N-acetylglucosamine transferase